MMGKSGDKWYEDFEITTFVLAGQPDEARKNAVSELNKILQPMGGSIEISEMGLEEKVYFLTLKLSPDAAAAHSRRGAGRKAKETTKLVRVKKVREMLAQRPAESVAAELGISRSTLFRRLKGLDDEDLF